MTPENVRAAERVFAEHGEFIRTILDCHAPKHGVVADDLYQDFFQALVRNPLPANVKNVRSFLYRAIMHDMVDAVRRQANYRRLVEKYGEETRNSINNETPTDAFVLVEDRETLYKSLTRRLRKNQATAVMLRYRDRRSIAEIAALMGIQRRTVSRYLSTALARLRQATVID
jgi:RNA polymerase sigma factor (sigma-70 family)